MGGDAASVNLGLLHGTRDGCCTVSCTQFVAAAAIMF